MYFPLSFWDISLWIAVTAIILLVTSELIAPYSDRFGDFVIEKKRVRLVALLLGVMFLVTVILRIAMPL
jgi:hypothetical protein